MANRILSSLGLGDGKSFDRGSLALIIVSITIFYFTLIMEFFIKRPKVDIFTLILGLILAAAGFLMRVIGQHNLGKQFRLGVKIVKGHDLIRSGIHSHIRHPMYTGMFLWLLGFSMMFSSVYSILVLFLIITPVGIYRTYVEEKALKKHFGKQYIKYCKKTKRFIPYIL